MKYILNRDVGEYKKGTEFIHKNNPTNIEKTIEKIAIGTWLALGWLDEVDGKWKPENMNEEYWYIGPDLSVTRMFFCVDSRIDENLIDVGNCFPTRAKAEEARDKIKELLASLK